MTSRSHPATRLVWAWYGSIWLVILAAAVYSLARGHALASLPVAAPFGTLGMFSILAARAATRLFACLAVATLIAPFYLFEAYLALTVDTTKLAHVEELREQGLAAYPTVFPSGFLQLWQKGGEGLKSPIEIEGREILPLAGIPDVLTVYCRVAYTRWITYQSDGMGFRNPVPVEWTAAPEFALLGDSFVQGTCVPDANTYAAQVSRLGATVSYGMNGTSTLTQAAIYREYAQALRPRRIVWFFYEGSDVHEYLAERAWPLLRAYLDPAYSQDLVAMNGAVAGALKRFIDQQLAQGDVATVVHDPETGFHLLPETLDFLLLRRARGALWHLWTPPEPITLPALSEAEWRDLEKLWREVIDAQHTQGGEITFVYIPAHSRFQGEDPAPFRALERQVVTLWSDLGVDFLTLSAPLETLANPLAYYDGIHFNDEGYRLTAETVVEHLRGAPSSSEGGRARSDIASLAHAEPPGSTWQPAQF